MENPEIQNNFYSEVNLSKMMNIVATFGGKLPNTTKIAHSKFFESKRKNVTIDLFRALINSFRHIDKDEAAKLELEVVDHFNKFEYDIAKDQFWITSHL